MKINVSFMSFMVLCCAIGLMLAIVGPLCVTRGARFARADCDEIVEKDMAKLAAALRTFANERSDLGCNLKLDPAAFDLVEYLVGPYYGWTGTSAKCEVKIRIAGDEVWGCSTIGIAAGGNIGRYIHRVKIADGSLLNPAVGPCEGRSYAKIGMGREAICYTDSMLSEIDCSLQRPSWISCEELFAREAALGSRRPTHGEDSRCRRK